MIASSRHRAWPSDAIAFQMADLGFSDLLLSDDDAFASLLGGLMTWSALAHIIVSAMRNNCPATVLDVDYHRWASLDLAGLAYLASATACCRAGRSRLPG